MVDNANHSRWWFSETTQSTVGSRYNLHSWPIYT